MPSLNIGSIWVTEKDAALLRRALGRRKLVLASASPRRQRVLEQCAVEFIVRPVEVGETIEPGCSPAGHVRKWSRIKALAAAHTTRRGLILAADTIVYYRRILGKPADEADARRLLAALSGRTHMVYTGLTLVAVPDWLMAYGWRTTRVRFHRVGARAISEYVRTGEPLDKAGAYGIQGMGGRLVADIDGPLDNVVGLPVRRTAELIDRLNGKRTS
jgi:septum formation protein